MAVTLAIASHTIRDAARSRLLAALAIGLPAIVIGLPLVIMGDGTAAGEIRIVLNYTLGAVGILLAVATLWASCGAISREIEQKQLRLIAVKPVYRSQIWLGRWLGLLAINAVLLALCGVAACGIARWKTRDGALTATERQALSDQVLVGRTRIAARQDDPDREVRRRFHSLRSAGSIPDSVPDRVVLDFIRKRVIAERSVVPPAGSMTWSFAVPRSLPEDRAIDLRFRLQSPGHTTQPAYGTWILQTERQPKLFTFPMRGYIDGVHRISIPAGTVRGGMQLQVGFMNEAQGVSRTLVFPAGPSVELLVRETGFEMNLARALFVIFCRLAALAALGLTAGALFSFPVASFVASAVVFATLASHYLVSASAPEYAAESHNHAPQGPSLLEKAGEALADKLKVVVEPAIRLDVLESLSDGILIPWRSAGGAFLILVVLYSGLLGLLGSYVLSRRELALPG